MPWGRKGKVLKMRGANQRSDPQDQRCAGSCVHPQGGNSYVSGRSTGIHLPKSGPRERPKGRENTSLHYMGWFARVGQREMRLDKDLRVTKISSRFWGGWGEMGKGARMRLVVLRSAVLHEAGSNQ